MSAGVHVFDPALHEANLWVKGVKERLATDDDHVAYLALRSTLHALRDRIGPEAAVHLGAQLPMLVRGLYYEGWRMSAPPSKERHLEDFLAHVARFLPTGLHTEARRLASAVFDLLQEKVAPGEVRKVVNMLPEALRGLWPAEASAG